MSDEHDDVVTAPPLPPVDEAAQIGEPPPAPVALYRGKLVETHGGNVVIVDGDAGEAMFQVNEGHGAGLGQIVTVYNDGSVQLGAV